MGDPIVLVGNTAEGPQGAFEMRFQLLPPADAGRVRRLRLGSRNLL
jgi:hypothetical protein